MSADVAGLCGRWHKRLRMCVAGYELTRVVCVCVCSVYILIRVLLVRASLLFPLVSVLSLTFCKRFCVGDVIYLMWLAGFVRPVAQVLAYVWQDTNWCE